MPTLPKLNRRADYFSQPRGLGTLPQYNIDRGI